MSLIEKIFGSKKNYAQEAKNRLTLMLAHDRTSNVPYMYALKEEILEVIKKYTQAQKIDIKTDYNHNFNTHEDVLLLDK